jgi:hypothetical protein
LALYRQSHIKTAFTYIRPTGNRFNRGDRGAWYWAWDMLTSTQELGFHRIRELGFKRHRSRTLLRAHLAIIDHLLAIEVPDPFFAQIALQGGKGRGLAAARWFAYLAHIDYVKIDEIAKSCKAGHG